MRIMNRHIRHIFLLTLAIVVMAACGGGGSDVPTTVSPPTTTPTPTPDPTPQPTPEPQPAEPQPVAIGFRADLSDAVATTRSAPDPGDGVLTTDILKNKGFGVYCWYTGSANFTTPKASRPAGATYTMLMRNQKVEYITISNDPEEGYWTYSPSKYWPLNPSELLTFRAYAPYTDYIVTDDNGMPQLPVMVDKDDYHNGSQHDPLWGTGKHDGTLDSDDATTDNEVYGKLYNNYTYAMSGDKLASDSRDGTIDWYFHHGMAMLVFYAKLDENASGTAEIVSITIGPLYNQGLLDISSPATSSSDVPAWGDRGGNMNVTLYGHHDTETQDLNEYVINKDELKQLMPLTTPEGQPKGLLVIPRAGYTTSSPLTITVSYKANDQINTVTTTLPNDKSGFNEFLGNKIYKLNLTVGNALVADIESVNVATTTNWNEKEGEHEVYNW